jgi:hypothetical protein
LKKRKRKVGLAYLLICFAKKESGGHSFLGFQKREKRRLLLSLLLWLYDHLMGACRGYSIF